MSEPMTPTAKERDAYKQALREWLWSDAEDPGTLRQYLTRTRKASEG